MEKSKPLKLPPDTKNVGSAWEIKGDVLVLYRSSLVGKKLVVSMSAYKWNSHLLKEIKRAQSSALTQTALEEN